LTGVSVRDYVSADIFVMLNIPSREGLSIMHPRRRGFIHLSLVRLKESLAEENLPKHSIAASFSL
jgi:hypothetical protein